MGFEFSFDSAKAANADNGGYILTGGIYVGVITKMKSFKNDKGSAGVEFGFESIDGAKCDYIKIYTKNNDGSENFAKGKIDSLMGIVGVQKVPAVQTQDGFEFPALCNKRVAVHLRREDYCKNDGSIGFKLELIHFYTPDTLQTYKEKIGNLPAKVSTVKVEDKKLETKAKVDDWGESGTLPPIADNYVSPDGMPF
jgi:hypothetical protein